MVQPSPNAKSAKPNNRRWFQFGLRTLLVLTVLCGCVSAWIASERQTSAQHRKDFAALNKISRGIGFSPSKAGRPEWLQAILGDDPTKRVTASGLDFTAVNDDSLKHLRAFEGLEELYLHSTSITDEGLTQVKELSNLQYLSLSDTKVSDVGLACVRKMTKLQYLKLTRTGISDSSIAYIKGLTQLKVLEVGGTKISATGLESLRQSLPNCQVNNFPPYRKK